jgi:acetyl-CoA C-acetyltransferase
MSDVVVVDAVRTPIGRRRGGLSGTHPANTLAHALRALVDRTGIDPAGVGQVIGGCVTQIGEQSTNIARTGWLTAGLPLQVPSTTIDSQCGSSQQATSLASALVGAGLVDLAIGCGTESMSRIPIGSSLDPARGFGEYLPAEYEKHFEATTQFEGAERIAEKWGVTRADTDAFGKRSQDLAAQAWAEGRFDSQIAPIEVAERDAEGNPTGGTVIVSRDEGLRDTTLEGLAKLKPVARPDGVHTAGNSSQISDGAAAILLASAAKAEQLGLTPRARIVDSLLVGSDPELMLTGPIPATAALLERNDLTVDDIDIFEVNEAFASVVLAWQKETGADPDRVNVNGGAIALGHPLGATGAFLITKALNELERRQGRLALITMCCGGGLGTGMLLERI